MKKFIIASVVMAAVAVSAVKANAQIVYYSFNNSSLLNGTTAGTNAFLGADTGSSISTFSYGSSLLSPNTQFFAGTVLGAQPGFAAGNTASSNGSLGDANSYVQFTLNATGDQNLIVSWAAARSTSASNVGAATNTLEYSTDGGSTFAVAGVFSIGSAVASGGFVPFTNDFTSVTALNNNASDVFRIYYSQDYIPSTGLQSAQGTERMDNLTIGATAVPEPSTVMLVGAGMLGLLAIRRRRS